MRDFLTKTWRLLLEEKKRGEFVTIVISVFVFVLGVFGAVWLVFVYLYPPQPATTIPNPSSVTVKDVKRSDQDPKQPSINIEGSKLEKSPIITGHNNKVQIGK